MGATTPPRSVVSLDRTEVLPSPRGSEQCVYRHCRSARCTANGTDYPHRFDPYTTACACPRESEPFRPRLERLLYSASETTHRRGRCIAPSRYTGGLEGLNRMRGNLHVRFLGEGVAARLPPYP